MESCSLIYYQINTFLLIDLNCIKGVSNGLLDVSRFLDVSGFLGVLDVSGLLDNFGFLDTSGINMVLIPLYFSILVHLYFSI